MRTRPRGKLLLASLVALALILSGAVAIGLIAKGSSASQLSTQDTRTVELAGQTIRVAVAATDAARQKGLGGRAELAPNEGMLFIFPKDGIYPFWMKDMRFSLDILWLSADGRVVYMVENVSPDTYPKMFASPTPARDVLELPAGWTSAHNVRIGDVVGL